MKHRELGTVNKNPHIYCDTISPWFSEAAHIASITYVVENL